MIPRMTESEDCIGTCPHKKLLLTRFFDIDTRLSSERPATLVHLTA